MISSNSLVKGFSLEWTPSREIDVVGYLVHWVHEDDPVFINGTFTPNASNLKHRGPETKVNFNNVDPGRYFFRVSAYDLFEDVDNFAYGTLNYSPAVATSSLDLKVLPDELYGSLRTDFWVKDSIFNFTHVDLPASASKQLNWTVGKIIRDEITYDLAAGGAANANNKYVIATLTTGIPNTAAISLIDFGGVPTVGDNQIIIAVTSATPTNTTVNGVTTGTNNYICFMRQANSMEMEGAIIRDATIGDAKISGTLSANRIQTLNGGVNITGSEITLTNLGTTASWDGVTGTGKPEDNATVGANATNLRVGISANQVQNSDFLNGSNSGWGNANLTISSIFGVNLSGWYPDGGNAGYLYQADSGTTGHSIIFSNAIPVTEGARYEFHARTGAHRCYVEVYVNWYSGTNIFITNSTTYGNNQEMEGGTTLAGYKVTGGFAVAPVGATYAKLILRKNATTAPNLDSWMFATQAYFGVAHAGQTALSDWSPSTPSIGGLGYTGALDATNGATWGVNLIPPNRFAETPQGAGLSITPTHMGYFDGGSWKTYQDNVGNAQWGNPATGYGLQWNQAAGTLTIRGIFDAQDINALDLNAASITTGVLNVKSTKSVFGRYENNLRIIRGTLGVNSTSQPTINQGVGFTAARTDVGTYLVTFNDTFSVVPTVTASLSAFGMETITLAQHAVYASGYGGDDTNKMQILTYAGINRTDLPMTSIHFTVIGVD